MNNISPFQDFVYDARKRVLLVRFGGLGDCLILTAIAKILHERGNIVDVAVGTPTGDIEDLFSGLDFINSVKKINFLRGILTIKDENEHNIPIDIVKQDYDEVFDLKYSIEGNTPHRGNKGWRDSINSNFANWVDLSLAWCKIDPSTILSENKRPIINTTGDNYVKYHQWISENIPLDGRLIGIQLKASSLIRTWYRATELPQMIHEKYPNDIVAMFTGDKWILLSKYGKTDLAIPEDFNPITFSTVLISIMGCFISADSGMSHVAEAVETPTIGIYTTVPAWTRIKHYNFAHPIEADVECHPCFYLDGVCPIEAENARASLSDREKEIVQMFEANTPVQEIAKKFEMIPGALFAEAEAIQKKIQTRATKMPACVASISPDMIIQRLEEVLPETKQW